MLNGFYGEFSISNEYVITQVNNDSSKGFLFHIGDRVESIDGRDISELTYEVIVQILSTISLQSRYCMRISPLRELREASIYWKDLYEN
jgi:hypothetical protein